MKIKHLIVLFLIFTFSFGYAQKSHNVNKKLPSLVEKAYQSFSPAGLAVAMVKDGKTELFAYGSRNAETGEPVTPQSVFNIASCTKAFTAAAIGQLVEEGVISWDDHVTDYIPELRLNDPYITKELNIVDILSHRSGLTTFTGDLLWYHTDYSDEEVIRRMQFLPVENNFRVDYGYQNNMFMIAGEIIERVTGKSWSQYIKETIFNPLGMNHTLPSNDEIEPGMEIAYPHLNGKPAPLYDFNATKPAASIHSSADDLSKWVTMLLNSGEYNDTRILKQGVLEANFSPQTIINVSASQQKRGINFRAYGMGWSMYDYHGKKIIEHNGGMPGYISKVTLVPEENLGFVILNNGFEFFIHNALKEDILELYIDSGEERDWIKTYSDQKNIYLKREEKEKEERVNNRVNDTEPSLSIKEYAGTYNDKMYGNAEIKMDEEGVPVLSLIPAEEVMTSTMKHWHYNTFRVDFKDPFLPFGLVTFDFDSQGEIAGFKIDLPINDFHFYDLYFKKLDSDESN